MTIYKDQLEAVSKLLEAPERWTRGASARSVRGDVVPYYDKLACSWCLDGAFQKCGMSLPFQELRAALFDDGWRDHIDYNDTHTHLEVLALLQQAIDKAPVRP